MKCFLTLVLLALLGLLFWAYRSRVRTAFKAITAAYIVILAINIVRASSDEDSSGTVLAVLAGAAVLWGAGWVLVNLWNRRNAGSQGR